MRLGVISDVYENLPVLETVLESVPSVGQLVCAGDVVSCDPWSEECMSELVEQDVPTVSGNHDRAVTSGTGFRFNSMAAAGIDYTRDTLSPALMNWLSALPESRMLTNDQVELAHGHPNHPDRYTYPDDFSPSLLNDEDLLVLGHAHMQGHRIHDGGIVLNPGSVGQPRDDDPRTAYAVVDFDATEIEAKRVNHGIDRVTERVRRTGLPERLVSQLYKGR